MSSTPPRGPVTIGVFTLFGEHCVLGYAKERRAREWQRCGDVGPPSPVVIGDRCMLFNHVVVYEGCSIGDECVLEDRVRVGYDTRMGPGSRLMYGAYVCDRVSIGSEARVAGFVCDGTSIGDRSTVMGDLVHEYSRPHAGWWETDEDPPVIEADTVVGYGARVIGGVRVGPCSYVAAGAVVTRDVPPEHVVTGVNIHTPASQWTGRRLRDLIAHWSTVGSGRAVPG